MRKNNIFAYYLENKIFEIGFSNKYFDFKKFFKNKKYVILKQIHSDIVLKVEGPIINGEGDGIITDKRDLYLIVKTADCYPVIAYNDKERFIAALHSGWRGVYKNIFNTFKNKAMEFADKERVENHTKFIIGPGICERCYQVSKNFYEQFLKIGFSDDCFNFKDNSIYFNIGKGIENRLSELKFKKENIMGIKMCTYENSSLFSYRRDGSNLRLFNFIKIK